MLHTDTRWRPVELAKLSAMRLRLTIACPRPVNVDKGCSGAWDTEGEGELSREGVDVDKNVGEGTGFEGKSRVSRQGVDAEKRDQERKGCCC